MPLRMSVQKEDVPVVPFEKCAAKTARDGRPGISVLAHCVHTGRVAEALGRSLCESVRSRLPGRYALAASLHDVGKASPGYQLKYFRDTVVARYADGLRGHSGFCDKHASIGAAAIDCWLGTRPLATPLAKAVAAHHGEADTGYPAEGSGKLGGGAWRDERRRLIEALYQAFGTDASERFEHPGTDAALLAGLVCVSDWIASDEGLFPPDGAPARPAEEACEACGFTPTAIRRGLSFGDVFGFEPRDVQTQFIGQVTGPGVYVLEAPMGIGKTEAALYAAYRLMEAGHHAGFYFALPTRLTSDRIHRRVAEFLGRITEGGASPRLAHGMAWLSEYARGGSDEKEGRPFGWFNPMKRALLYPYAVGTIDQALLAVMNVRHSFVRLFGLAGKVVILDEVHCYDMYTGSLLDALVQRLRGLGCTVIILSATLSTARRKALSPGLPDTDAYPVIAGVREGAAIARLLPVPAARQVSIRLEAWDVAGVAKAAVGQASKGLCVVCIANTVSKAQNWYRAVKSEMPEGAFEAGLLHARFTQGRREELEAEWMEALGKGDAKRPKGCVLIATQVIEQSVDIDADWMVSELAPTDMLLQRMGRLWRHERPGRSCAEAACVIVAGDTGACVTLEDLDGALGKENCAVYAPYLLLRSDEIWRQRRAVTLPHDIRALVEGTYAERDEQSPLMREAKEALQKRCEKLRSLACAAGAGVCGLPAKSDDDTAPTRYSDYPMRMVLLAKEVIEKSSSETEIRFLDGTGVLANRYRPSFDVTRKLYAQTASVAWYLVPETRPSGHGWLNAHIRDNPCLLILDDRSDRLCYNGDIQTELGYSSEIGIYRHDAAVCFAESEDADFKLPEDW